jgi:hypothetical protein
LTKADIFLKVKSIERQIQKRMRPNIIQRFMARIPWLRTKDDRLLFSRIVGIEKQYKTLPAIEKLKYVNMANSASVEDLEYAKNKIAAIFERDMVFKIGFLNAHD